MEKYIAIYLRLSDDDIDIENDRIESQSIENQRSLIREYLKKNTELSHYMIREFVDDGFSGVDFERPGIQKLLQEVKSQHIACIVVKDFSRFGRNYIAVGDYIEQIFPFMGVRFISVADEYDSNFRQPGIEVGLRNLLHDLYSRDLSKKIKTVKRLHQKQKHYTGGDVPYGYIRNPEKEPIFIPDPEASKVVKRIFKLASEGKRLGQIADILSEEKVPTKGVYKNQNGNQNDNIRNTRRALWINNEVKDILENEVYIGRYICGKSTTIAPRVQRKNDEKDYIIFEDAHEPLVDEETLRLAQAVIPPYRQHIKRNHHRHVLQGKVRCGYCRYCMVRYKTKNPYFSCYMGNRCGSHLTIKVAVLEEVVLKLIQNYMRISLGESDLEKVKIGQIETKIKELRVSKKALEIRKDNYKVRRINLYRQWREERISQEEYLKEKQECLNKEKKAQQECEEVEIKIKRLMFWMNQGEEENLDVRIPAQILTKDMVDRLVEEILVYDQDRIEIKWKFQDVIKEVEL